MRGRPSLRRHSLDSSIRSGAARSRIAAPAVGWAWACISCARLLWRTVAQLRSIPPKTEGQSSQCDYRKRDPCQDLGVSSAGASRACRDRIADLWRSYRGLKVLSTRTDRDQDLVSVEPDQGITRNDPW